MSAEEVLTAFHQELDQALAAADKMSGLERIRSTFFGPKGKFTELTRGIGQLPPEQRKDAGRVIHQKKTEAESRLTDLLARAESEARAAELRSSRADLTLPARALEPRGAIHPIYRVMYEMIDLFGRMGFEVAQGPEVELDHYNFEALNFPKDHPARDMQDTFFVKPPAIDRNLGELVLRTHTSPVQIREMEKHGAPIRIVVPGRVYRCDSDATHSPMFHQVEILCVDEGISFAHLKGVLTSFLNAFFGTRAVRFRPSFFPFVEPGCEVDMQCVQCNGSGCRLCKQTGWMEILGAGMVHPYLLESVGIDPEKYTGFAAGLGIDRIAMLRWAIDDLTHLFKGDVRFLGQL